MKEDETISSYNKKIIEISNEAQSLEDPITKIRLVHKILCIVPKRFDAKTRAIKKTKNTDIVSQNELVSILRMFEMNTSQKDETTNSKVKHSQVQKKNHHL